MEDTEQRDVDLDGHGTGDGKPNAGNRDNGKLDDGKLDTGAQPQDSTAPGKLEAELESYKDKYLRALAELENFKKRALKERSDLLRYQGEPVLNDMLPVLDNLERALQHKEADQAAFRSGVELILKQLLDVFGKWDVQAIPAIGRPFDPSKFNALSKVPVDDAPPGTIISELKRGYSFKDRLLRPGDVVVAAEKPEPQDKEESPQS